MKIITIVSDRNVLIQRTEYECGIITTDFCAVGRFSKWPQKMKDVTWSTISAIAGDHRDKKRKECLP